MRIYVYIYIYTRRSRESDGPFSKADPLCDAPTKGAQPDSPRSEISGFRSLKHPKWFGGYQTVQTQMCLRLPLGSSLLPA